MDPPELESLVRDHDRWLWAAKGAIALSFLFIGLIVYVFNDVRSELRRKIDIEVAAERFDRISTHMEYLNARVDRLRDMLSAPPEHRNGP
jgi:hypothetical protein